MDQTNNSFSRIHFTIEYDEGINSWIVYDGNGEKKSLNGTWLFVQDTFKITNNIKFRIEDSEFAIELVNN